MLAILLVVGLILLVLWVLGFAIGFLAGPVLWILLVIALVLLIMWLVPRVRSRH
jgi:hypothetical protein